MKNQDPDPPAESNEEVEHGPSEQTNPARRKILKVAGLSFIVGGLSKPGSAKTTPNPAQPSASGGCGAASPTGRGYNDDKTCGPTENGGSDGACGLLRDFGPGAGAGGAAYNDNDCNAPAGQSIASSPDNDCGKHNGPLAGGMVDNYCGTAKHIPDSDCGIKQGLLTVNVDNDCEQSGKDNAPCWLIDTSDDPYPGDDPLCIHFKDNDQDAGDPKPAGN